MKFIILLAICFSSRLIACDGGLPGKLLEIPEHSIHANTMTEVDFRKTIKEFTAFFSPIIEQDQNAELIVFGSWSSNTVNAFADQSKGKIMITIYGGLARHKAMNRDGLMATLCHELGHHLGGYPKKQTNRWSSAEGQADYYATMKCLRRIWQKADNLSALKDVEVPMLVKQECARTFSNNDSQFLCQRMSMAGKAVALMIQALDHDSIEPKFETPDDLVVRSNNYMHPFAQCRLDTYFQGSLCAVSEFIDFDIQDPLIGACHPQLGDERGNRPRCWFAR
jgi:hypothetical protein